jgi:hypothetical protein
MSDKTISFKEWRMKESKRLRWSFNSLTNWLYATRSVIAVPKVFPPGYIKNFMVPESFEVNPLCRPDGDEVAMKEWCISTSEGMCISPHAIYMRWRRGKYPGLKIRRVNSRVVFVRYERRT